MGLRLIQNLLIIIVLTSSSFAEEHYTKEERNALKKFRSRVSDVIVHDHEGVDSNLINFIRARDTLQEAEAMFRENQKWRLDNKIDSILNETLIEFNSPPYTLDGHDREGNPILAFTPTHIDLRRLLLQGLRDKVIRMWWQMMEKTAVKRLELSEKLGKEITKSVSVLDLTGYNIRQHFCLSCVSVYTDWFTTLEKYYPGRVKHFVIINVPRIAIPFVELVRPLLAPSTNKALRVFPPNKKEWSAYLQKIVDPSQLPYRFGGTKKASM